MRFARAASAVLLGLAFAWPLLPAAGGAGGPPPPRGTVEWPLEVEGETLRPLALGDVERRFASRFPGAIGRFASGEATWILRRVERPTRMLHPAADCYRGLGFEVRDERLVQGPAGIQRCFGARRAGVALEVCERITGADGSVHADTSAWYWAALLGRSRGPWLAATRAVPAG